MDDFILAAQGLAVLKLALSLSLVAAFGWGVERIFGLSPKADIDAFQKAARDGQALPLALFYLGVLYLLSVLLGRFQ